MNKGPLSFHWSDLCCLHSAKPDRNLLNREMEDDLPPEALAFLTKLNIFFFIILLIILVIIAIFWLIELYM